MISTIFLWVFHGFPIKPRWIRRWCVSNIPWPRCLRPRGPRGRWGRCPWRSRCRGKVNQEIYYQICYYYVYIYTLKYIYIYVYMYVHRIYIYISFYSYNSWYYHCTTAWFGGHIVNVQNQRPFPPNVEDAYCFSAFFHARSRPRLRRGRQSGK